MGFAIRWKVVLTRRMGVNRERESEEGEEGVVVAVDVSDREDLRSSRV